MRRLLLCGWLALVLPLNAQGSPDAPASQGEKGDAGSAKEKIKTGFKTAGKAVGEAAVKVGHGVRDGAKAVGQAGKKVGHGFKEGGKAVGHGVKSVVKGDKAEKD